MLFGGASQKRHLPGFEALHDSTRQVAQPIEFNELELDLFSRPEPYYSYLNHPSYRRYVQMHKVIVRDGGSEQLLKIAQGLEGEKLPEFLDAAGWAYAESALAGVSLCPEDRLNRVEQAEQLWQEGIAAHDGLNNSQLQDALRSDARPFRMALNLVFTPLIKGIITGDVSRDIRKGVYADMLAVSQLVSIHTNLAWRDGVKEGVGDLSGLTHECNTLLALLYLDDPRYVPLPSSSRADSGYYHADQTHDITIINQHYGNIKKAIPVEVKARPSGRDKRRYKALMISKNDLTHRIDATAYSTLEAFGKVFDGTATDKDRYITQTVSERVKDLLSDYQKAGRHTGARMDTVSKFYRDPRRGQYYRQRLGQSAHAMAS